MCARACGPLMGCIGSISENKGRVGLSEASRGLRGAGEACQEVPVWRVRLPTGPGCGAGAARLRLGSSVALLLTSCSTVHITCLSRSLSLISAQCVNNSHHYAVKSVSQRAQRASVHRWFPVLPVCTPAPLAHQIAAHLEQSAFYHMITFPLNFSGSSLTCLFLYQDLR